MGKRFIIIALLIGLFIAFLAYAKYIKLKEQEAYSKNIEAQSSLISAQTAQSEACKQNWMCATTNILTGLGSLTSGVSVFGA